MKCDEGKPACLRCKRGGHHCQGYGIHGRRSKAATITNAKLSHGNDMESQNPVRTHSNAMTSINALDDKLVSEECEANTSVDCIDPALLNISMDVAWQELMSTFTLLHEGERDAPDDSSTSNLMSLASAAKYIENIERDKDAEEAELICAARDAYDEAVLTMDTLGKEAFDRGLRWFPPAFSKAQGAMDDRFFCQLEKEPWARVFLHLSAKSAMVRSFIILIGTRFGPVHSSANLVAGETWSNDLNKRGKQEYVRAMKALQTSRVRVTRLQYAHEWSSNDFCFTLQYIAVVILFMLYEELDRSMTQSNIEIWSHVVGLVGEMPELSCKHPFRASCDRSGHSITTSKRIPLCKFVEKRHIDNFRVLTRILYWKDTLYRVVGPGAGPLANSKHFIDSIRVWEAGDLYACSGCLRSSSLSSMAFWTPELLDIVACATQRIECANGDLLQCLLCRVRVARLQSVLIEDEGFSNRRIILFDMLRFTVQILVVLTLNPKSRLKETDLLRIQASLRICHVATTDESANVEWNDSTFMVDTNIIFEEVQSYLHLNLAFPFLLAATQIESSELQDSLLQSLQKLSSQDSLVRVADRSKDSISFLRLLLQKIYASSHVRKGKPLMSVILSALEDCHFAKGTQLLTT